MSDRKYRQRGYQDDDRDRPSPQKSRPAPEPGAPAGARRISGDAPKNINMPGYREVVRCSQCGNVGTADIGYDARCPRCGTDLHACAQCASFGKNTPPATVPRMAGSIERTAAASIGRAGTPRRSTAAAS